MIAIWSFRTQVTLKLFRLSVVTRWRSTALCITMSPSLQMDVGLLLSFAVSKPILLESFSLHKDLMSSMSSDYLNQIQNGLLNGRDNIHKKFCLETASKHIGQLGQDSAKEGEAGQMASERVIRVKFSERKQIASYGSNHSVSVCSCVETGRDRRVLCKPCKPPILQPCNPA